MTAARAVATMRAVVVHEAGGPSVLKIQPWPKPKPQAGQVLIRIKAFGLNRSEVYTRQGLSPTVKFPRVLGIEAVGLVEESPSGEFSKDDVVATCMGEMGRQFDGGYAEYTCVPAAQVIALKTYKSKPEKDIPWALVGALPEMMNTAWGSLFKSLRLTKDDDLLIRGGTTSVGLAAAVIAKSIGARVAATTRKPERVEFLKRNGADEVFIDNGAIADELKKRHPAKFSKVLEFIGGVPGLKDTMQCVRDQGIVCIAGSMVEQWTLNGFSPHEVIPTSVCLTTFSSAGDFLSTPLDDLVQLVADRPFPFPIKTFHFDQIVEAHQAMGDNTALAKIVVLV